MEPSNPVPKLLVIVDTEGVIDRVNVRVGVTVGVGSGDTAPYATKNSNDLDTVQLCGPYLYDLNLILSTPIIKTKQKAGLIN